MSILRNKLFKQTSIYFIGELLIFAGGFFSFPIFTRLLSKEEYGIMSLISITLLLVETVSSLGLRHSTQRFFSENQGDEFNKFYSTVLYSSFLFSIAGTTAIILAVGLLSLTGQIQEILFHMFLLASLLIVARVMTKIIASIYRVNENATIATSIMILNKYAGMLLSIYFIAIYYYGVWGFYLGLVLGEITIVVIGMYLIAKHIGIPSLSHFSRGKLREMTTYGFPMVLSGFASYILSMGDRYVIAYFESPEQVAEYSVPYNLCTYIISAIVTAFQYSLIPIIMNSWNKNDFEDVKYQMQNVIKSYAFITLPIIFGIIAVGDELISLLASDKYTHTSGLLAYFIVAEVLYGFYTPLIIGLQFYKKTTVLIKITVMAAIVNIILNIILVPIFSLQGSAMATLISIILLLAYGSFESFKYYKPSFPWLTIAKYFTCALFMFIGINMVKNHFGLGLAYLVIIGSVMYGIAILLIDNEFRKFALSFIKAH